MHRFSFIISELLVPPYPSTLYKPDISLRRTVRVGPGGVRLREVYCILLKRLFISCGFIFKVTFIQMQNNLNRHYLF